MIGSVAHLVKGPTPTGRGSRDRGSHRGAVSAASGERPFHPVLPAPFSGHSTERGSCADAVQLALIVRGRGALFILMVPGSAVRCPVADGPGCRRAAPGGRSEDLSSFSPPSRKLVSGRPLSATRIVGHPRDLVLRGQRNVRFALFRPDAQHAVSPQEGSTGRSRVKKARGIPNLRQNNARFMVVCPTQVQYTFGWGRGLARWAGLSPGARMTAFADAPVTPSSDVPVTTEAVVANGVSPRSCPGLPEWDDECSYGFTRSLMTHGRLGGR